MPVPRRSADPGWRAWLGRRVHTQLPSATRVNQGGPARTAPSNHWVLTRQPVFALWCLFCGCLFAAWKSSPYKGRQQPGVRLPRHYPPSPPTQRWAWRRCQQETWCPDAYEPNRRQLRGGGGVLPLSFVLFLRKTAFRSEHSPASYISEASRSRTPRKEASAGWGSWSLPRAQSSVGTF